MSEKYLHVYDIRIKLVIGRQVDRFELICGEKNFHEKEKRKQKD